MTKYEERERRIYTAFCAYQLAITNWGNRFGDDDATLDEKALRYGESKGVTRADIAKVKRMTLGKIARMVEAQTKRNEAARAAWMRRVLK